MSNKAYLFRLRTKEDINDLNSLFNCGTVPYFWDNLYKPNRAIGSFKKTDLVAAITVDRGDLRLAFYEEAGVKKTKHLYFKLLEEVKYNLIETDDGFSVSNWDILKSHNGDYLNTGIELPKKNHWVEIAKDYLIKDKNIDHLIWDQKTFHTD